MTRVKGGRRTRRRHKKILVQTKGQRGTKHRLFKRANEAMMKSEWYAYRDRRTRKRDFRRLWITRINAAARQNGLNYSQVLPILKYADIKDANNDDFDLNNGPIPVETIGLVYITIILGPMIFCDIAYTFYKKSKRRRDCWK